MVEPLKLENQICFPFYAISRLIIRAYQPYLEKLGITYPQYLVLLVLWEKDGVSVQYIGDKLILNTNTLTPLLKRMESLDLVVRQKALDDERMVIILLTDKGRQLKTRAKDIPHKLMGKISDSDFNFEELISMKGKLQDWMNFLEKKQL